MTPRRLVPLLAALAVLSALPATPAQAQFGLHDFEVSFTEADGSPTTQAGAHPYEMTTSFYANTTELEGGQVVPFEPIKDVLVAQIEGFAGNPSAVPVCSTADFLAKDSAALPNCPDGSAVGEVGVQITAEPVLAKGVVFSLDPPPGAPAKLGFFINGVPVTVDVGVEESPPYRVLANSHNISQILNFYGAEFTLWGLPADPRHDGERGKCIFSGSCPAGAAEVPFLTMPRACGRPLATDWAIDPWPRPGAFVFGSFDSPQMVGCEKLSFGPEISARPTSRAAQSPSGLDFTLAVADEGLTNPNEGALAASDIERAVVTLPKGMTVNPSQAEGLEVCTESQLARERADSGPGRGCPQASKIGTIEVETPLLEDEILPGSLYVAEPYRNLADDSLIAVYVVIKDPQLGIKVIQPLRVEPDPETGQLITYSEDMPQLPFSAFRLRFREGGRAPLITPPGCGSFEAKGVFYPYSRPTSSVSTSDFEIVSGPEEGPCPQGAAPFEPGFEAGTLNNAAGAYSPFAMRITRADGMQDLSNFSAVLPPGVLGKLAGVPWCPEAGIERAKSRTGKDGGQDELKDPSCPAASAIGRTLAGAGVGSQLTYVGGSLYLAGPYKGAPLSVVSITPAVAGPFDAGVVVVRVGLRLNPKTGVVEADGAASDPIPHILQGIPLNVRDLRVFTDRPAFTLNATNCEESSTFATLWGAGTVLEPSFATPVVRAARYQAAGCAALGFSPKLGIKLRGGVRRGAHPALRAHVVPRPGDANFSRAVVTLPRSAFLEQGHIRTICTRVQFAAGAGNGAACPPGAVYGKARAWSPLLDEPLQGPVFLRSSDNNLPDLVVALHGPPSAAIEIELSARIDSVKGGIRSTFTGIPDAPVSRFILDMQGGKKGLIVNSRHLCFKPKRNRAKSNIRGQNGRLSRTRPRVVATTCQKRRKAKRKRAKRSSGHVARASRVG